MQDATPSWRRWLQGSERSTYLVTRFAILRLLGLVYFVAFLTVVDQGRGLLGTHGLTPIASYLHRIAELEGGRWPGFIATPSLFWLASSDAMLDALGYAGLLLSLAVVFGYASGLLLIARWVLHTSFANVGPLWYGFGWEFQLLETGLLAVFLVPFLDGRPLSSRAPPRASIYLFRWLLFRIMLGAGLIKLRGDACWRDLSCLAYHYETQPVPNPLSAWFHAMPDWIHQTGVLYNHVCELIAPFFVFGPRRLRHVAGVLLLSFQGLLIASGNLSYLNWLTIVPILACFDDSFYRHLFPRRMRPALDRRRLAASTTRAARLCAGFFAVVVGVLSLRPIANLFDERQLMNSSFDRLHVVNTYGAFGTVGKERHELVFEGSYSDAPGDGDWFEMELKCKPGDVHRSPCQISPYHYRLDWLLWFAAMGTPSASPWCFHLVYRLLAGEPTVLALLAPGPWRSRPPQVVRVVYYAYELEAPFSAAVWKRRRLGLWMPETRLDDPELQSLLRSYGWLPKGPPQRTAD